MLRRLVNFATILSLALLVATVALWVRSYYGTDDADITFYENNAVGRLHPFHELRLQGSTGVVFFQSKRGWAIPRGTFEYGYAQLLPQKLRWGRYEVPASGFFWLRSDSFDGGFHYIHAAVPFWLVFALTSIIPALALVRSRRNHDPANCRLCGYNLTANVSGICPECGSKLPAYLESAKAIR